MSGRHRGVLPIPVPGRLSGPRVRRPRKFALGATGAEVVCSRDVQVPYFQLRLRLRGGDHRDPYGGATARLLSASFLGGTTLRGSEALSRALQACGASVSIQIRSDHTLVAAEGLSVNFEEAMGLVSEVLFGPAYPPDEVEAARMRVAQSLAISRNEPSRIASNALRKAMFGRHPYGRPTPPSRAVAEVSRLRLHSLHRRVVRAGGARFVLVSDMRPERVVRALERNFGDSSNGAVPAHWLRPAAPLEKSPRIVATRRVVLVDRPGAVQSTIRIGMPAPRRTEPGYYGFLLANTCFGGYFSSRLVENVREDKGYAYGIGSKISHRNLASTLTVATDVATEVTASALVEIFYEMDRLAVVPPDNPELESAKRYLVGATALSLDTSSGLADTLDSLFADGLDERYLNDLAKRVEAVGRDEVAEAAATWIDRRKAVVVVVGDAGRVAKDLERACRSDIEVVGSVEEI